MRLLVTGAGGMLGHDVLRAGERAGHELVGLSRAELDVTDTTAVERAIERTRPEAVINCAAWTDVDGAETHREQANAITGDGARNLALAAALIAFAVQSGELGDRLRLRRGGVRG